MNYASLMLGAVLIFALLYYLIYGRRFYNGVSLDLGLEQTLGWSRPWVGADLGYGAIENGMIVQSTWKV
jgi:hypothetical protein